MPQQPERRRDAKVEARAVADRVDGRALAHSGHGLVRLHERRLAVLASQRGTRGEVNRVEMCVAFVEPRLEAIGLDLQHEVSIQLRQSFRSRAYDWVILVEDVHHVTHTRQHQALVRPVLVANCRANQRARRSAERPAI